MYIIRSVCRRVYKIACVLAIYLSLSVFTVFAHQSWLMFGSSKRFWIAFERVRELGNDAWFTFWKWQWLCLCMFVMMFWCLLILCAHNLFCLKYVCNAWIVYSSCMRTFSKSNVNGTFDCGEFVPWDSDVFGYVCAVITSWLFCVYFDNSLCTCMMLSVCICVFCNY